MADHFTRGAPATHSDAQERVTSSVTPQGVMPLNLHDYQKLAVDFLRDRNRAALFLDMGLG